MVGEKVKIYQHPCFRAEIKDLIKIDDFVCGSKARTVNSTYVTQYVTEADNTKEAAEAYSSRLARGYNKNISRPYLEIHFAHLSQPVTIASAGGPMDEVVADATGFNQSFDAVLRNAMWDFMKHGRVGVLVDAENMQASNGAEESANGHRSYSVIFPATHIVEWELFSRGINKGKFEKVTLFEKPYFEDGKTYTRALRMFDPGGSSNWVWQRLQATEAKDSTFYTQTQFDAEAQDFTVIEEGEGATVDIPFVMLGEGLDDSLIFQNVEYNWAHLNLLSTVQNIIYNQGFQRSIIVGDIDETSFKKSGPNLVWVSRGQSLAVHDIPPGNPEAGFRELAQLELLAMRTGLMQTYQLMDDTRAVQSAESKALDNKARISEYDRICDLFEDFATKILRFHAEYEGSNPDAIAVTIGRDFGLDDPQAIALQEQMATSLANQVGILTVTKEVLKNVVAKLPLVAAEGETVEDKRKALFDEIDAASGPQAQQPARLSFSQQGQQVSLATLAAGNA